MKTAIFLAFSLISTLAAAQDPKPAAPVEKQATEQKQPSFADLVRQAKERRSRGKKPVRTFSNADLARLQGANVSTGEAGAAAPEEGSQSALGDDAAGEAGSAEAGQSAAGELTPEELRKWKEAFDEARVNLQNAVNEALVLQLRMNNLRNAFLSRSDGPTQERVQAQLQETLDQIEKNRQAQREARAAIEKLQRDAQAAGLSREQIERFTGQLPGEPPSVLSETTGGSS